MVIDLHSPEVQSDQDIAEQDSYYEGLSTAVAIACKILLSHAHRINYKRRTQPQPPLTMKPQPRLVYSILRPLLALLEHQSALSRMTNFLGSLEDTLQSAGQDLSAETPKGLFDFQALLEIQKTTNAPLVEIYANGISAPLQAQCTLTLPSTSGSIRIRINNHSLGTDYRITIDASPDSSLSGLQQEPPPFTSPDTVEEYLMHLIMLDLVSMVAAEDKKWQPLSVNEGQLSTDPDLMGRYQVITLSVERDRLELRCRGADEHEISDNVFVWSTGIKGEKGLLETAQALGSI
jgi:hypothetical protein